MHHSNHRLSADFECQASIHRGGGCQMQSCDCRQRLLADKVAGRQQRNCGLFAILRNDCDFGAAFLKVENRVSWVTLAEKCLSGFQFDDGSAKSSVGKKGRGIELGDVRVRQVATSIQAVDGKWAADALEAAIVVWSSRDVCAQLLKTRGCSIQSFRTNRPAQPGNLTSTRCVLRGTILRWNQSTASAPVITVNPCSSSLEWGVFDWSILLPA